MRTRNHIGMKRLKCLLCELSLKEAEEKSNRKKQRNSSPLLRQKTIYLKDLLQNMTEITTKSILAKPESGVIWNSSRCGRFLAGRFATPSTVTVKIAGLLPMVISNTFCTPLNKLFSIPITCCGFSVSFCCLCPQLLLNITSREDIFNRFL